MLTANSYTLEELACEYQEFSRELFTIDFQDEDALNDFYALQEWGIELHERAREFGFAWEKVEAAASGDLEGN